MSSSPSGDDKKTAHMKRRRSQGLPFKEVAAEFGTSKSTAHRKARQTKPKAKMNMRKGVIDMGPAS